jgi:hypothetical protein
MIIVTILIEAAGAHRLPGDVFWSFGTTVTFAMRCSVD